MEGKLSGETIFILIEIGVYFLANAELCTTSRSQRPAIA